MGNMKIGAEREPGYLWGVSQGENFLRFDDRDTAEMFAILLAGDRWVSTVSEDSTTPHPGWRKVTWFTTAEWGQAEPVLEFTRPVKTSEQLQAEEGATSSTETGTHKSPCLTCCVRGEDCSAGCCDAGVLPHHGGLVAQSQGEWEADGSATCTLLVPGESGDPFYTGPLEPGSRLAVADEGPLSVQYEGRHWTVEDGSHWGTALTLDEAWRYYLGAVFGPLDEAYNEARLSVMLIEHGASPDDVESVDLMPSAWCEWYEVPTSRRPQWAVSHCDGGTTDTEHGRLCAEHEAAYGAAH